MPASAASNPTPLLPFEPSTGSKIVLTPEGRVRFVEALADESGPSERLVEAARRYRRRFGV